MQYFRQKLIRPTVLRVLILKLITLITKSYNIL